MSNNFCNCYAPELNWFSRVYETQRDFRPPASYVVQHFIELLRLGGYMYNFDNGILHSRSASPWVESADLHRSHLLFLISMRTNLSYLL